MALDGVGLAQVRAASLCAAEAQRGWGPPRAAALGSVPSSSTSLLGLSADSPPHSHTVVLAALRTPSGSDWEGRCAMCWSPVEGRGDSGPRRSPPRPRNGVGPPGTSEVLALDEGQRRTHLRKVRDSDLFLSPSPCPPTALSPCVSFESPGRSPRPRWPGALPRPLSVQTLTSSKARRQWGGAGRGGDTV